MHSHPESSASSKPFLKWAGGKRRLLSQLLPLLPLGRRLIEPFVGAGSVFLASQYDEFLINDANPDLAALWVALRQRPDEVIVRASSFFATAYHSKEAYLSVRDDFNESADRFERAVRLPYLNKFGFNGLYRVNRAGRYNVPYGSPARLPTFPWEQVEAAARRLQRCLVLSGGFSGAMSQAAAGDVVYCDPPYLDGEHGTSFTAYTASAFGRNEHEALCKEALAAAARGARVLISNHDTPETRALYQGFSLIPLSAWRSISGASDSRLVAGELVAIL